MASFDYTDVAQTAIDMVAEFGRTITLIQLSASPADPTMPWRGATDPRGVPVASKTCLAVFVDPFSLRALGLTNVADDFLKRANQIAVIATSEDLAPYNEVVDADGSRWRVTFVHMLKPAAQNLLAYVGVTR